MRLIYAYKTSVCEHNSDENLSYLKDIQSKAVNLIIIQGLYGYSPKPERLMLYIEKKEHQHILLAQLSPYYSWETALSFSVKGFSEYVEKLGDIAHLTMPLFLQRLTHSIRKYLIQPEYKRDTQVKCRGPPINKQNEIYGAYKPRGSWTFIPPEGPTDIRSRAELTLENKLIQEDTILKNVQKMITNDLEVFRLIHNTEIALYARQSRQKK